MGKKKNTIKVVLEYSHKDICTIYGYQKFLTKHLKSGDKIPARVLNKFFSFFEVEQSRLKHELKKRSDIVKKQTVDRFLTDKEYVFNKKLADGVQFSDAFATIKNKETKSVCCLEDMLNSIFGKIELNLLKDEKQTSKKTEKERFIILINTYINEYFSKFKGDSLKILSKYKRDAIIGFMAFKFGVQMPKEIEDYEDEDPPNKLLYEAVAYRTSKKVKKSK